MKLAEAEVIEPKVEQEAKVTLAQAFELTNAVRSGKRTARKVISVKGFDSVTNRNL